MTAEIVNLRQARKAKALAEKQRQAETNRAKFGRTKAEKEKSKEEGERQARLLDGHHLDNENDPDPEKS